MDLAFLTFVRQQAQTPSQEDAARLLYRLVNNRGDFLGGALRDRENLQRFSQSDVDEAYKLVEAYQGKTVCQLLLTGVSLAETSYSEERVAINARSLRRRLDALRITGGQLMLAGLGLTCAGLAASLLFLSVGNLKAARSSSVGFGVFAILATVASSVHDAANKKVDQLAPYARQISQ